MQNKCKSLEDKVTSLEENLNCLDHYGRTNNIVYSGMLECVADDALEATVASILSDIDVDVDSNALEECHRFGKPERRTKSRKTIVRFTNRKYCKKALLNWKKLANLDNEKHQLGSSTTIFISKNENIAFKARKLKRRGAIHGYFTRDAVVHIKLSEHDKAIKILHKNHFCKYILDCEEEEDLFHVSQEVNNSVQSSYWETLSADYFLGWLDWYELFPFCEQHLLCYKNWILKFWSRWSVQKKQTYSKSGCFFWSDFNT